MNTFFIVLLTIISLEVVFNILYFLKNKKIYKKKKKILYSRIHYIGHPYLPFVLKKRFKNHGNTSIDYPIKQKYELTSPELKSNNLGFYNGNNGNKHVVLKNKKNKIRINCLGGSTTMNYLGGQNDNNTSYPIELQKKLDLYQKNKYEVNNFGQGLYNSTDVLVRFITSHINTKPDIIILYIGYNDIRSYLTNNFSSDHSHSRKTLNFSKFKIFLNYIAFDFKLSFLNYFLSKISVYNIKDSLTQEISKGKFNLNNSPKKGLKIFAQNIELIIIICSRMKIKLVMSSFCFYKHKTIKNNKLHLKFQKIINEENKILKKLARKNAIPFVDNNLAIEKKDLNFVDSIHFSKKGMTNLAENFFKEIIKLRIK